MNDPLHVDPFRSAPGEPGWWGRTGPAIVAVAHLLLDFAWRSAIAAIGLKLISHLAAKTMPLLVARGLSFYEAILAIFAAVLLAGSLRVVTRQLFD